MSAVTLISGARMFALCQERTLHGFVAYVLQGANRITSDIAASEFRAATA
jgi:hypothetical protein